MKLMLIGKDQRSKIKDQNQGGLTSIVVVFVLVVLLTLVGIGFSKIMNRSLQSSSAAQQSAAAGYAVQSSINDAVTYIKNTLQANPNANISATACDDLIKSGAPLAEASKLSGDNTEYTCLLIDPGPTSLFYDSLPAYKSQIIKMTTASPVSNLLFSWQATDRTYNQFVPNNEGQALYDEATWATKKYVPVLRVSLYPIPPSGDLGSAETNAKTYFLYPQIGGGQNSYSYNSGGALSVNCQSKNLGSFSGSAEYDCNTVISNLPDSATAAYYYVRLTPYYNQAMVKIKANDAANQAVKFDKVQTVIDATARSGNAVKRLEARINSSGLDSISPNENAFPEFALRSASTLCKRLIVSGADVFMDSNSLERCSLDLPPQPKPDFALSANPPSRTINPGQNADYTITVTPKNKFNDTVNLSVSGLPSGATASFSPATINTSGNSQLAVSTTGGVAPGTYTLTISGTSGTLTRTENVTLIVSAASPVTVSTRTKGVGLIYTSLTLNMNVNPGGTPAKAWIDWDFKWRYDATGKFSYTAGRNPLTGGAGYDPIDVGSGTSPVELSLGTHPECWPFWPYTNCLVPGQYSYRAHACNYPYCPGNPKADSTKDIVGDVWYVGVGGGSTRGCHTIDNDYLGNGTVSIGYSSCATGASDTPPNSYSPAEYIVYDYDWKATACNGRVTGSGSGTVPNTVKWRPSENVYIGYGANYTVPTDLGHYEFTWAQRDQNNNIHTWYRPTTVWDDYPGNSGKKCT